jgi:polysaccharide pyruvyl transferase WcaK-like protein
MNKNPKILIAEGFPTLNKGALELIEGILKTFDILGRTEVYIFSLYPELDRKRYPRRIGLTDICKDLHIERFLRGGSPNSELLASILAGIQHLLFVSLYRLFGKNALGLMRKPVWKKYCSSDVFITCISEDDCVNGNYLKFSPVYISLLAKTLRKLAIVYANSNTKTTNTVWIWRLQSRRLWKVLARYFLNNMDLITTRDKDTFELYRSLAGSRIPLYFTGDVGILLEPADPLTVKRIMTQEKIDKNDGLLIGASITRRLLSHSFPDISDNNERYEKGVSEIASVFDRLIAKYRSNIVFISHCIEYTRNNDDRVVGNDILKKMKNKANFKVITKEYTPQELKGLIGQLDILVGDRVHALISALSMNVPCCALAYRSDRRPYNLIGKDFEQQKWIFEVDTFNKDTLYELLTDLISSCDEIRKNLPLMTRRAKERALLNGQLLSSLLSTRQRTCMPTPK